MAQDGKPMHGSPATAARTALILGGSRGIGLGCARTLVDEGYLVTIAGRRSGTLTEAAAALDAPGLVEPVVVDLRDPQSCAELVEGLRVRHGALDVLVLSAGIGRGGPLEEAGLVQYDEVFSVNMRGSFDMLTRCFPLLAKGARNHGASRVLLISSVLGLVPEKGLALYSATKAALLSLSRSVNEEWAEHGIRATAICPGYVDTKMSQWKTDLIPAADMIPVGDVGAAVAFVTRLSAGVAVPVIELRRATARFAEA